MPRQNDSREIVASNVRLLLGHYGLSARRVAERAGLNNRTVSNIARASHSAGVETLDALADVFNIPAWKLLYPWPTVDLLTSKKTSRLLYHYTCSSADGRDMIEHIAQREHSLTNPN